MVDFVIDNRKLDLYSDENIEYKESIKNLSSIDTAIISYSTDFTIPATDNNKAILNYFNDGDNGLGNDMRRPISCLLFIDGALFKAGSLKVNSGEIKNGQSAFYSVTFFDSSLPAIELMKTKKLKELNFDFANHDYNVNTIYECMTQYDIDYFYPCIDNGDNYNTAESSVGLTGTSIVINGVNLRKLKPAISINAIIRAINDNLQLPNLRGLITYGGVTGLTELNRLYILNDDNQENMFSSFDPSNILIATLSQTYTATANEVKTVDITGFPTYARFSVWVNGVFRRYGVGDVTVVAGDVLSFKAESYNSVIDFTANSLTVKKKTTGQSVFNVNNPLFQKYRTVRMVDYVPDMTVAEFIGNICKMFNLVITNYDALNNILDFRKFNSYMQLGDIVDIDKYVDISNIQVKLPTTFINLGFKYLSYEGISNRYFFERNKREFGNLEAFFDFGTSEKYEVYPQFSLPLIERLSYDNNPLATTLSNYTIIRNTDADLKPIKSKNILFYKQDKEASNLGRAIKYKSFEPNLADKTSSFFYPISTSYGGNSVLFSTDTDPFTLSPVANSLYVRNYQSMINNIYAREQREYIVKAYELPSNVKINSTVIIKGRKYIISEMTKNLTNKLTTLTIRKWTS